MKPPWSYVPALPLLIALVGGILLSKFITENDILIIPAIVCLAGSCLIFRFRYYAVLLLAVAVGYTAEYLTEYNLRASIPGGDASYIVTGEVISVGESDMSQRLVLKLHEPYSGVCYVMVPDYNYNIREYDIVSFTGRFEQLPISSIYDDVSLDDFYYRRGITCYCKANNGSLRVVGRATGIKPIMSQYRERLIDIVLNSDTSPSTQSFVIALILGDDTYLEQSKRDEFASSGIAHILALSGMHIAIIVTILSFMFLPLRLFGYRKLSFILTIVMLWGYAVMTGLSPSVTRATIMFTLILLAKCIGRYNSTCNSLFVAAIIILVCSPRELFTPGFQLSFIAVSGIVILPAIIKRGSDSVVKRWLVNYCIFTIAAVFSTVFLVAYYFHQIPLYFIVTNLMCGIMIPLILIIGIIVIIFGVCGIENILLNRVLDVTCGTIEHVAHYISDIEISVIDNIYISWWAVLLAYMSVLLMVSAVYYRRKRTAALSGILVFSIILISVVVSDDTDVLMVRSYSNGTQVLYTNGHDGYVITTEKGNVRNYIENITYNRHHGFWARHGIENIKNLTPSSGEDNVSVIKFYNYRLLLVNGNISMRDTTHFNYIIIGNGFKDDIVELGYRLVCDTILLGYDIRMPRRQRYENELNEAGIPVRVMNQHNGLMLSSDSP